MRTLIVRRLWDDPSASNRAPVARLVGPTTGIVEQTVEVDPSTSSDLDGVIRKWTVAWGDGTTTTFLGAFRTAQHSYLVAGIYDITLTVWDNRKATASTALTVTIADPPEGPPDPPPTPVDCVVSAWAFGSAGAWGVCQSNNTQTRAEIWLRTVVTAPAHGGQPCGPLSETRVGTQACVFAAPVDCVLSAWSLQTADAWGACLVNNTQTRAETWARTVVTAPANGGAACGQLTEQRIGSQACVYVPPDVPVDCVLSAWALQSAGSWGVCGPNSQQSRSETWARTVVTQPTFGGAACGPLTEARVGTQACVYTPNPQPPVDCVLSAWAMASASAWGACQPNSTQTRSESWVRTVVTPASNGGAACGPLSETRSGSQACVYTPPAPPPSGGGAHTYYNALITRSDVLLAKSLRSQAIIDSVAQNTPQTGWVYDAGVDAAKGTITGVYPADSDIRPQLWFPINITSGSVTIIWDYFRGAAWEAEPVGFTYQGNPRPGLLSLKAFQVRSPPSHIMFEIRNHFSGATGAGNIATIDMRHYGQTGPGTSRNANPFGANSDTIQPLLVRTYVRAKWLRYVWKLAVNPGGIDHVWLWVIEEGGSPVQIYNDIQFQNEGGLSHFDLEEDASQGRAPGSATLVTYARNVVILRDVANVTPLLVAPV